MKKEVDGNQIMVQALPVTNTNHHMKLKVIAKLIAWGNNPSEVTAMVESNFENALCYGYKTTAQIAEYIRTVA
jgi:hypothetical protein